ncbi:hypothetical protein [Yoonia sp. SDW83-1]|uniref:hypothetical protein n=1 Tax=Yoonia sp. SDW83-1 TaxID=3366945 RepID=UPI00398C4481
MTPRPATIDDVSMLARVHVQAWQEAYPDLLPAAEIAVRTFEKRQFLWARVLSKEHGRVWLIEDKGFAHIGPQREDMWRERGYPEELYAMYLIRDGYGLGRPLLEAAFGPDGRPFTACVLEGNDRACAFYEKSGGQLLMTRDEMVGASQVVERVYGWTAAPFAG